MSETAVAYPEQLSAASRRQSALDSVAASVRTTRRPALVAAAVAFVLAATSGSSTRLVTVIVATAVWVAALHGSYRGRGPAALALGPAVAAGVGPLTGVVSLSLLAFRFPEVHLTERQLLLMAAVVFAVAAIDAAYTSRRARQRVVFVGADEGVREVLTELARHPRLPFEVIGFVDDGREEAVAGTRRLGSTGELAPILREEAADLVVLGGASRVEALSQVLDLASLDVRVVDVHHFNEHAFGKVPVHHLSPVWFMSVLHLYQRPYPRLVKRTVDVVVAGAALVALAPVLGVLALIVRLSSPGPVFFRQLRLGEGGKLFEIRKFRTMVDNAEAPGRAVWAAEDDARVTRVGRVMRRLRLDELPQLWNVLRGEMSIVGPRPERPEFLELLRETVPFWTRRHLVKPGITGWAQVRRGYTADVMGTADKLSYDLYYLKYRSLLFDLAIVSRTAGIVLSGFGSR